MAAKSEYVFVDKLPDKYRCSICKNVLDEPVLTDCCGQHFCKNCLEGWFGLLKSGLKTCPHCQSNNFNYMKYIPLKREINDLKIYCSNCSKGCSEQFSLSTLESHLDTCSFVTVDCSNKCGEALLRKDLEEHYQKTCPNRNVKCEHCTLTGLHKDITGEHLKACPDFPLHCPSNCGEREIKRRDLEAHKQLCPQEPVQCPFFEAGCKEKLTRKDLDTHTASNTQHHLQSVMTTLMSLKSQHQDLQDKFANLVTSVSEEVDHIDKNGRGDHVPNKSLKCIKTTLDLATSMLVPGAQEYWLHFKRESDNRLRTPSFYMSPGYKMYLLCVEDIPVPQQRRPLSRASVKSCFSLILQRSRNDDSLPWPIPNDTEIYVQVIGDNLPSPTAPKNSYYDLRTPKDIKLCTNCNPSLDLSRITDDSVKRVFLSLEGMQLPKDSSIYCHISLKKHQCEPKQ